MFLTRIPLTCVGGLILAIVAFVLPAGLLGQTLETRSGEVFVGRVLKVEDQSVQIAVGYPEETTMTLDRVKLTPLSVYVALASQAQPNDAQAHLRLARACVDLGLPIYAIAEYREAARLDPALKTDSDAKILEVRRALAADLLADAREAFDENRLSAARLLVMSILGTYKDTPSANEASQLLEKIKTQESAGRKVHEVPASDVETALRKMGGHLKSADQAGTPSPHGGSKEQRRLESLVAHLEQAWAAIKDLAAAPGEKEIGDRLTSARDQTRRRLVDAYLSLGAIYLGRRAIPNAEANCEKACELDPENKDNHALHDLILNAKLVGGRTKASGR
jgi:tetratricopeptide (TPR) repeat protein